MKDPDELQAGDDFSGFMSGAIPERLRNRALRKLWLTNPVLANIDELVDYGEDFTDAATVVENLQTAYRVGKGFLRQEEIAPEPEGDDSSDDAETTATEGEDVEDGETSPVFSPDENSPEAEVVSNVSDNFEAPDTALPHEDEGFTGQTTPGRRRRMVFRSA